MIIPSDAIIGREKITRYLLAPRAKNDKSRYLARAGFDQSNPDALEAAIRLASAKTEAEFDRANEHGRYYNVCCELTGPDGYRLPVVLIWLCRLDEVYTFVTLVPARER